MFQFWGQLLVIGGVGGFLGYLLEKSEVESLSEKRGVVIDWGCLPFDKGMREKQQFVRTWSCSLL